MHYYLNQFSVRVCIYIFKISSTKARKKVQLPVTIVLENFQMMLKLYMLELEFMPWVKADEIYDLIDFFSKRNQDHAIEKLIRLFELGT